MISSRNTDLLACFVAVMTALPSVARAAEKLEADQLLDPAKLLEIRIEVADDDWAELCRQSPNASAFFGGGTATPQNRSYTYFRADLWIGETKIESVGIRKKGFLGSNDGRRPSLKVKFDEFVKQDPVRGLSRLTLNNNKQDRSLVSQMLTYQLFRDAGVAAPRSNLARVTVNGNYLGIYSNVESIKKSFLKRNFDSSKGNLYEGQISDFHPLALGNIEVKNNEKKNDLSDIKRLADILAKEGDLDLKELRKVVDLDHFMRFWAIEGLTGFWDGYAANQNNYYVYFNPDNGKGYFIPWGADWVFSSRSPFDRFGGGGLTVVYAQSILANRLYHSPGIPEAYKKTMQTVFEAAWDEAKMLKRIDEVEQLVLPYLGETQREVPQAMDEIRTFIRSRKQQVLDALARGPANIPDQPRTPSHTVIVGSAAGAFSTVFGNQSDERGSQDTKADLTIELDKKTVVIEQVAVRIRPYQPPRFGGFGRPAERDSDQPPLVSLTFEGTRESNRQPVSLSVIIERSQLKKPPNKPIDVVGRWNEGNGNSQFGGFGRGPRRSVNGQIQLTKSGIEQGDSIEGRVELKIVESRGGFFSNNRSRTTGNQRSTPRQKPDPARLARLKKAVTLLNKLDANKNGTIEPKEWANSDLPLGEADANSDQSISLRELTEFFKTDANASEK